MKTRHLRPWSLLTLAAACLLATALTANAATLYVDAANETGVEDGTKDNPYSTINAAVAAAVSRDTIRVAAGTYTEDVTIDSKALKLLGADPATTTIRGFNAVIYVTGTFATGADVVEIAGFTITLGGTAGVYCDSATAKGSVHNCILVASYNGVLASSGCSINAYNNVISESSHVGLRADNGSTITGNNNIFTNNENAVFSYEGSNVSCSNNTFFGNTENCSALYSSHSCPSANNTFEEDCLFVDLGSSNFHLQAGSPCINAGSSFAADNDPDGTRNDKGVYGGPGAAGFWPTPAGSPVVTELSVTPHDVPLGGTLTVTATGTTR